METIEAISDDQDLEYVMREFVALETSCAQFGYDLNIALAEIAQGSRPAPCYVVANGTLYVPLDYFQLETDREEFIKKLINAASREGLVVSETDAEETWADFLTGIYGVCLRHATPENIARKTATMQRIVGLLEHPRVDESDWTETLRRATDDLDALEREFSPNFDRRRFGRPPSRDTFIRDVRARYLDG